MKIKIFIRTFTTAEDAEMFNSVLNSDISMDGTGIACTGLPKKVLVAYGS